MRDPIASEWVDFADSFLAIAATLFVLLVVAAVVVRVVENLFPAN